MVRIHPPLASALAAVAAAGALALGATQADAQEIRALRVCADPGNMPLSNDKGEGFQNKIAQVLGEALGTGVQYDFRPSTERGLMRGTLDANMCDVMFDLPVGLERVLTTRPVYRSTFVLASRTDRKLRFENLDDPRLKKLKIGVYQMSSVREALADHGIKDNTVTHFISYDGATVPEHQPTYQVQRMIDGELDLVAIWGPFAGWYKTIKQAPITLQPVNLMTADPPLQFEMALGVRRGDRGLRDKLDEVLVSRKDQIRAILEEYGVPLVQCAECVISGELVAQQVAAEPKTEVASMATPSGGTGASLDQLKRWLKEGADPNDELSNAATAGDVVRVRYLLEHGADVDTRDDEGYTPLLTAVKTRYNDLTRFLIQHGADVNLADRDGWTPLMYAAWRDSPEIVGMLLEKGAQLETANQQGLTPLCIAAQHGRSGAIAALLAAGANANLSVGAGGYTPLMLALVGGWDDAAAKLVERGADVNAQNKAGITPLIIAAAANRVDSVRLLLQHGADAGAASEDGTTALGIASERDNRAVVEVLEQARASGGGSGGPAQRG